MAVYFALSIHDMAKHWPTVGIGHGFTDVTDLERITEIADALIASAGNEGKRFSPGRRRCLFELHFRICVFVFVCVFV